MYTEYGFAKTWDSIGMIFVIFGAVYFLTCDTALHDYDDYKMEMVVNDDVYHKL